jgi:protein tyrosine/serine phosphatase
MMEITTKPTVSRRNPRRLSRSVFVVVLLVLAAPAALLSRSWWGSNLGVVDPGRVFRAAQPTTRLAQFIDEYHLATILNLRGGSFKDPWYVAEVQTAERTGVAFLDLPLSASKRPTRRELLLLIDTLARCRYPLLIHCKAGADRTGLASAIYLMTHRGEPPRQAARAFTIYHSHIPLFGPEHLHEPLDEYADWLEASGLTHTPERFRDWVRNEYQSADPSADPPPLTPGPRKSLAARQTG